MTERISEVFKKASNRMFKDPGVREITAQLDTGVWSTRKRNLVIEALQTKVADCSYEMGDLIANLLAQVGDSAVQLHRHSRSVPVHHIKPEKLDDLVTYTAAWCRLAVANASQDKYAHYGATWEERNFLAWVDGKGNHIWGIPMPKTMSKKERTEFLQPYLVERDELVSEAMQELIEQIRNGEVITVTVS